MDAYELSHKIDSTKIQCHPNKQQIFDFVTVIRFVFNFWSVSLSRFLSFSISIKTQTKMKKKINSDLWQNRTKEESLSTRNYIGKKSLNILSEFNITVKFNVPFKKLEHLFASQRLKKMYVIFSIFAAISFRKASVSSWCNDWKL